MISLGWPARVRFYLITLVWLGLVVAVVFAFAKTPLPPMRTIVVYFATPDGYLAPVPVRVPAAEATPRGALDALLRGPRDARWVAPIPPETRVLHFALDGPIATVTFSAPFDREAVGGTTGDELRVMAVVDTLTEWPQVKGVRIAVAGDAPAALSTHLEFDQPIQRDLSLLAPAWQH